MVLLWPTPLCEWGMLPQEVVNNFQSWRNFSYWVSSGLGLRISGLAEDAECCPSQAESCSPTVTWAELSHHSFCWLHGREQRKLFQRNPRNSMFLNPWDELGFAGLGRTWRKHPALLGGNYCCGFQFSHLFWRYLTDLHHEKREPWSGVFRTTQGT